MSNPSIRVDFSDNFVDDVKRLKKRYRRILDDVDTLVDRLRAGETPGDQITSVGYTVYKVRLKSRDIPKGKRSGFRVIYYIQSRHRRILLSIYVKSEQADVPAHEVMRLVEDVLSKED